MVTANNNCLLKAPSGVVYSVCNVQHIPETYDVTKVLSVRSYLCDYIITSGQGQRDQCLWTPAECVKWDHIRCGCDIKISPVFQVDWRVRLQADLQTLRHALLCVLCGLLGERTRNFRLNPGKVWVNRSVFMTGLAISCKLSSSDLLFFHEILAILGICGDAGQMLWERLWAWLNFSRRQGRKCQWIFQTWIF